MKHPHKGFRFILNRTYYGDSQDSEIGEDLDVLIKKGETWHEEHPDEEIWLTEERVIKWWKASRD